MRFVIDISGEYDERTNHYYVAEVVDAEGLWVSPYLGVTGYGDDEMHAFYWLAKNMVKDLPDPKEEKAKLSAWNKQCLDWSHIRDQIERNQAVQTEQSAQPKMEEQVV